MTKLTFILLWLQSRPEITRTKLERILSIPAGTLKQFERGAKPLAAKHIVSMYDHIQNMSKINETHNAKIN